SEAVLRIRSNTQKAGLLNVKPNSGVLDPKTGIRRTIEYGLELKPNAENSAVKEFLFRDTSFANEMGREILSLSPSSQDQRLNIPLDIYAERHRYEIQNQKAGVSVEWTGDFTHGLLPWDSDSDSGFVKGTILYGIEMELDHLGLSSQNVQKVGDSD